MDQTLILHLIILIYMQANYMWKHAQQAQVQWLKGIYISPCRINYLVTFYFCATEMRTYGSQVLIFNRQMEAKRKEACIDIIFWMHIFTIFPFSLCSGINVGYDLLHCPLHLWNACFLPIHILLDLIGEQHVTILGKLCIEFVYDLLYPLVV